MKGVLRQAGFTLVELMITVAIVGVLASVAVPLVTLTVQRSKEQELRAGLRQIRQAIDAYKQAVDEGKIAAAANESGYPRSLAVLVDGVENVKDPKKGKLYFLRRIPLDPMAGNALEPGEPWGTRSYSSTADDPQAGEDVFDVYSLSKGMGLNATRYREW
jgi:general secretion pathway protein G